MKWFRLYNDIIHNPKLLMVHPGDRWAYVGLLALKQEGVIDRFSGEKLDRVIAVQLRLTGAEWDETARRLIQEELITEDYQPIGWDERQYTADSSAERTRKYRNRLKNKESDGCDGHSDVTVTSTETETDTETETETEKTQSSEQSSAPRCPLGEIVSLYHDKLPNLPAVKKLTKTREGQIRQRWRDGDLPSLDVWADFFDYVGKSDFLCGRVDGRNGKPPFVADLEWITRPGNFVKIWEGKYHV